MNNDSITFFRDAIQSLRRPLEETEADTPFDKCLQLERQMTLNELEACFTLQGEALVARLKEFFSTRWKRIQGSGFSYTHMPSNALNQLCYNIAQELSPLPESEEEIDALSVGEGPYFLLMPTLKTASDIYGTNIHHFALRELIISDNGDVFIPIERCLSRAAISDTGELEHIVSETEEYRPLSEREAQGVIDSSEAAKSYYQAIVDLNKERLHGTSLGANLQRLSTQLMRGSARGTEDGKEFNAGAAANEGIVKFHEFWHGLPEDKRQALGQQYHGLEEIIGRLMRPDHTNYRRTIFCVQLLAEAIDTILEREKASIYTTFGLASLEENVKERQRLLSAEIARVEYKSTSKKLGRFFETLTELTLEKQLELTGYHNSLVYACFNEPHEMPAVLKKISLEERQSWLNNSRALILAAQQGNTIVVQALCDAGALLNETDYCGQTALGSAISKGHIDATKLLFERGASLLIRYENFNEALDNALRKYPALIEPILRKLVDCDDETQKRLLGARLNDSSPTVLSYFCINAPSLVPALLQNGTLEHQLNEKNGMGRPPIILAAQQGNTSAVQALCDAGASLNEADHCGQTALMSAIYKGHIDAAKLLLERGANPLIGRHFLGNALDIAVRSCPALIEPILCKLMDYDDGTQRELLHNMLGNDCPTVLSYFCINAPNLVPALLQKMRVNRTLAQYSNQRNEIGAAGAKLNATDDFLDTPIVWAINNRHIGVAKLLLASGEDPLIRNNEHENALDIAVRSRCQALIEPILLQMLRSNAYYKLPISERKKFMGDRAQAKLFAMCEHKQVLIKNGFMLYDHLQCLKDCANDASNEQYYLFRDWAQSLERSADHYIRELLANPDSEQLPSLRQEFRQCLEREADFHENKSLFVNILLNILIAATGIGLLLVAAKYLTTGSAFFTTPQRRCIAKIKQSLAELDTDVEMGQEIRAEI